MSDNGTSRSAPRRGALLWLVGRQRGKCVGEVWIPTPVCAPRALASRHALARNDSALRCGAMWASPPTRSQGVRAKGRPLIRSGTSRTPSPTGRDVEDAVPYRAGRRGAGHTKGIKREAPAGASLFMRSSCVLHYASLDFFRATMTPAVMSTAPMTLMRVICSSSRR